MGGWNEMRFSVKDAQDYADKISDIVDDGNVNAILDKLSALAIVSSCLIHSFYKKYNLKEKDYLEISLLKNLADSDKFLLNYSRTNFSHYMNLPELDYEQK